MFAWFVAFALRFNFETPPLYSDLATATVGWIVVVYLVVLYGFGLYRGIWRYASLTDLRRIVLAVSTAAITATTLIFLLQMPVPRSVIVLHPILLAAIMCGSRIAYRAWKERRAVSLVAGDREPGLVLGGGDAAERLVRELSRSVSWRVVGLLNDNLAEHGRQMHGIPVLGPSTAWRSGRRRIP